MSYDYKALLKNRTKVQNFFIRLRIIKIFYVPLPAFFNGAMVVFRLRTGKYRVTLIKTIFMNTIEISGVGRSAFGKKNASALRHDGYVPCNLYGNGDNVNFAIERKALKPLLYTPTAYLVKLNIDGHQETGVLRETQFHPVTDQPLHIDFYRVNEAKPLAIAVPVELKGSAEGTKLGGKLQQLTRKVTISALPKDLPDSVEVDITTLGLGNSIFVSDINISNISILTPKSTVICAVKMTRAAMGIAAAASTTAAAAPAAGAAGATPAAPAASKAKDKSKKDKDKKKK
jgi:large subunit ribosomal protein L25